MQEVIPLTDDKIKFCDRPYFSFVVLKLAARCNLNCSYCYWFKDDAVYQLPKKLTRSAQKNFIIRLRTYLQTYPLPEFHIVFHGGEPLLFGKKNFDYLCSEILDMSKEFSCELNFAITTNAILIDQGWADLFQKYNVNISISLDGDSEINDALRPDFKGNGSHERVVTAINLLRKNDLAFGVLAVCNPTTDPKILLRHFYHELQIKEFEILFPEITHHMPYISISRYYIELFDEWFDNYADEKIRIRNIDSFMRVLLGKGSFTDHIGYSANNSVSVFTDGSFGGPDELNLTGHNPNYLNLDKHEFVEVFDAPDWKEAYDASLNLHDTCNQCRYKIECGGGSLQSRWKKETRYNNVNVYCQDMQDILDHIANRLIQDVVLSVKHRE